MTAPEVVHVTAYYPPHLGGQEVAAQGLVTQLALIGKKVEVVTSDCGARRGRSIEDNVRVTRLRSSELGHTALVWPLFVWLLRHVRRETVIHLHAGQFFTPEVVWLAAKVKRFRYVIHLHIDPVPSGPMGKLLPLYKRLVFGRAIRDAAGIAVLNDDHRQVMKNVYHYRGSVSIVSNGIDEDFFELARKPAGALQLLFVGRLSPQKNVPALLEALGRIDTECTADIIGDGECRVALEELIVRKNLRNVTLHGRLSRTQIQSFYSNASALILPSLYEAQPMVLLEAMACRVPIICTRVVGVEAIARDVTILVEPTPEGICNGISIFAKMSPADRQRMVDAAFLRVQGLRWKTVTAAYVRLYEEVSAG
jgi:glycosyltransferase involved in cell wall biosynthesis